MLIFFSILQAPHTKLPQKHTVDLLNVLRWESYNSSLSTHYYPSCYHLCTICFLNQDFLAKQAVNKSLKVGRKQSSGRSFGLAVDEIAP